MMPKKIDHGKRFEEDFKKSVPDHWYYRRFKDSAGAWAGGEKTRFTASNECDCLIFNTDTGILFGLELKSFKGKSMPYKNMNDPKGKKLEKMIDINNKNRCVSGYVLNFRDLGETYFVNTCNIVLLIERRDRKSFAYSDIVFLGLRIPQALKKVRYKYDIERIYNRIGYNES